MEGSQREDLRHTSWVSEGRKSLDQKCNWVLPLAKLGSTGQAVLE
jgi:hypothetical protein